jgi:hypothetical protein
MAVASWQPQLASSSGEQHGHDDTCDHHHHRADRFRGRRLVRAGTVVVRQRDQPRTTHPAREPRGGSAAGLGHVAQAVARAVEQRLAMSAPMALAVIEELSSNADISPKVRLVASKALLSWLRSATGLQQTTLGRSTPRVSLAVVGQLVASPVA